MRKIIMALSLILLCSMSQNTVSAEAGNADPLAVEEAIDCTGDGLTVVEKVYGLSLIWKEAEYNFPFTKKFDSTSWEEEYKKALPRVIDTESTRAYYLELMRFLAILRDGHTDVWFPDALYDQYGQLPLKIEYLDEKIIITDVAVGLEALLADELLAIEGLPAQQYFEERVFPYIWHEKLDSIYGNNTLMWYIPIIEDGKALEITTSSGSYTVKAETDTIDWVRKDALEKGENLTELYSSGALTVHVTDDDIAVITIPTFTDDSLPDQFYDILPQIKDKKGFVIDVRENTGGSDGNANAVAQAFIEGPFATGRVQFLLHNAAYKAWLMPHRSLQTEVYTSQAPQCPTSIDAPLVVLEDAATASAAEDLLIILDFIDRATIVGTPSYGSTGNPLMAGLPGGGGFRICTLWCSYPNGKEFIDVGVTPHIHAALSAEDYRNNTDSVFCVAIDELRRQISHNSEFPP